MTEQLAHGAPRIGNRRLVAGGRVEPGAMDSGDIARLVGDRRDQGGPCPADIGGVVLGWMIEAMGMETKPFGIAKVADRAGRQIGAGKGAAERLRSGP